MFNCACLASYRAVFWVFRGLARGKSKSPTRDNAVAGLLGAALCYAEGAGCGAGAVALGVDWSSGMISWT
jgi:hypothetical protein